MRRRAAVATALLLAEVAPADAHIVTSRLGDFYTGVLHPLLGAEDLIVILALGAVAGMQAAARARWLALALPLGLVLGVALTGAGCVGALPAATAPVMMVMLGILLALAAALPTPLLLVVAAGVGVLRGWANGADIRAGTDIVLFTLGLLLVSYAIAMIAAAATLEFLRAAGGWRMVSLRACGSWIAAIGLMLATFSLKGP